jgi:DNA-directed RNA polymerase specialized sigma24 family protein
LRNQYDMVMTHPEVNDKVLLANESLFKDLYERAFPFVAKFVSARHGTFDEARDIFQDALIIYFEKLQTGLVHVRISDEAYITGIAKHLWLRRYETEIKHVRLDSFEESIVIDSEDSVHADSSKLTLFLERTGKKCMNLLQEFYFRNSSAEDIMKIFGFGSLHSATVQKFKCLEKVRNYVKEKSLRYEDFTE